MSAAQKRKAKPKAPRKAKAKAPRKRVVRAKKPVQKPVEPTPSKKVVAPERVFLFAIRLKGSFGVPVDVERTLASLRLNRRFNAVLLENSANAVTSLRKVKDYVTWGEAKRIDIARLLRERGELLGGVPLTDKSAHDKLGVQSVDGLASALADGSITLKTLLEKGLKPVFRLRPPTGGFEASAKRPHGTRGELGQRGPEITTLVARMS